MEIIENILKPFLENIGNYIDPLYLVTFMLLAYLGKNAFTDLLDSITKITWKPVYTVIIIAGLVAIPFAVTGTAWDKLLFTYALGTSLHEVAFQQIEKWIKR